MTFFRAIAAFFVILSTIFSGGLTSSPTKGDISGFSENVAEYRILPEFETDERGDFKILQISDTHFKTGVSFADVLNFQKIEDFTKKYSPDLVVISGDMIDGGESGAYNKKYVLDKVGNLFEALGQYWAYVPGNNDGLNYGTCADVVAYLSQFEHCLVRDEKDISGAAQYSIDIKKDGKTVHSLLFLDTMDYDIEDPDHKYGYVHEDQVLWAKREIEKKQSVNSNVKFSVFCHENTPNFQNAASNGSEYKSGYSMLTKLIDKMDIPKNAPLDKVFEDSKVVGLISIGHVHPAQNQCGYYNGTYYHITAKSSVMSTLITIHTLGDSTRNMYDFAKVS